MINRVLIKLTQGSSCFCLLFCITVSVCLTSGCAAVSNGRSGWFMYSKYRASADNESLGKKEDAAGKHDSVAASDESDDDPEKSSFGDKLLWYLPNRICDFFDCFTLEIGGGVNARLDLHLTSACCLGAGYGNEYMLGWDRRFFGGEKRWGDFDRIGYKADLFFLGVEQRNFENVFGNVPSYRVRRKGVVDIKAPEYKDNKRDFWALGADVGLLYNVKVEIHPLALADFISGLFLIDIEKDDDLPSPEEY